MPLFRVYYRHRNTDTSSEIEAPDGNAAYAALRKNFPGAAVKKVKAINAAEVKASDAEGAHHVTVQDLREKFKVKEAKR